MSRKKDHTGSSDLQQMNNDQIHSWFEDLINSLQVDKFLLENNMASSDTKTFYEKLMSGGERDIHAYGRMQSSKYFIQGIVGEYLKLKSKEQ